ncbi:MAG: NADH-quinone oxidoreductase subunit NuoK [Planctomycetes bacterium]|nr:NADH-quinone oxidoreductase subunit NuoK [Planctomycetota bacterium]
MSGYLALSLALFSIGALGVVLRRNLLVMLISIEVMLNAAILALVVFSRMYGSVDGRVMGILAIAVAAGEVAVGLALVIAFVRLRGRPDATAMDLLKW